MRASCTRSSTIGHRHRPTFSGCATVRALPKPSVRAAGRKRVGRPGSLGELEGTLEQRPALQIQRGGSRPPSSSASPLLSTLRRHGGPMHAHLSGPQWPPQLTARVRDSNRAAYPLRGGEVFGGGEQRVARGGGGGDQLFSIRAKLTLISSLLTSECVWPLSMRSEYSLALES